MTTVTRNMIEYHLQFVTIRDILRSYLTNVKGGNNAYNGAISDTRGGSRKAEVAPRYHQAVTQAEQTAGRQDRRIMAHQCIRIERLSGRATQETNKTTRLVLSVVQPLPITWNLLSNGLLPHYLHAQLYHVSYGNATLRPWLQEHAGGKGIVL